MSDLIDLTRDLIAIRKKPTTQDRFKQYPQMLSRFRDMIQSSNDVELLKQVIRLDSGYFLLAGDRQLVLEQLLTLDRTSDALRAYAMQLELFGDVDEFGQADLDIDARIQALYDEADSLDL